MYPKARIVENKFKNSTIILENETFGLEQLVTPLL